MGSLSRRVVSALERLEETKETTTVGIAHFDPGFEEMKFGDGPLVPFSWVLGKLFEYQLLINTWSPYFPRAHSCRSLLGGLSDEECHESIIFM